MIFLLTLSAFGQLAVSSFPIQRRKYFPPVNPILEEIAATDGADVDYALAEVVTYTANDDDDESIQQGLLDQDQRIMPVVAGKSIIIFTFSRSSVSGFS